MKLADLYKSADLMEIFVTKTEKPTKEKNNSAKTEHTGATSYHYYELNRTPAELDYHTGLRPEDIPNIYEDPEQKLIKGTEIDDYSNSYFPKTGSQYMKLSNIYNLIKKADTATSAAGTGLKDIWANLPSKYKVGLGVAGGIAGKSFYDDYKRQLAYAKVLRNMREQEELRRQQSNFGV